jgi:hypothetical protein
LGLFALLFCLSLAASDLPVPEELIGAQTVGIVTIDVKALKFDQIVKTITEKLGTAPDAVALAPAKDMLAKFAAAGGQSINIVLNAGKDTKAENAADGIALVVTPHEDGDADKLKEFLTAAAGPLMEQAAPGCPKKVGESLVWYNAKFKMPKANEDRAKSFAEAYSHLAKTATVSIVLVPDEEAVTKLEEGIKEAKPDEAETAKALLGASAYTIFTDLGAAAEPVLTVLVLAADADGAVALSKAADKALGDIKKDAPPPAVKFLSSLKTVQVGANVQMSIDLTALTEAIKGMTGGQ